MSETFPELYRLPRSIHADPARPWMQALEMQYLALRFAQFSMSDRFEQQSGAFHASREASYFLPKSDAFAWSKDISDAVLLAARTIPDTAEISAALLPSPACWWWFDTPLPIAENPSLIDNEDVDAMHVAALSLGTCDSGDLSMVMYRQLTSGSRAPVATSMLRILPATLGQIFDPGAFECMTTGEPTSLDTIKRIHELIRFVLAGCAWLKQRILVCSSGHIERHRRKQLARDYNAPPPTDVKVIELRRREVSHQPTSSAEDVAWSCRWIVNGHWRNQPYKHERKLIYIMPFVKGPADMPLKVPTHVVYQVNR